MLPGLLQYGIEHLHDKPLTAKTWDKVGSIEAGILRIPFSNEAMCC